MLGALHGPSTEHLPTIKNLQRENNNYTNLDSTGLAAQPPAFLTTSRNQEIQKSNLKGTNSK